MSTVSALSHLTLTAPTAHLLSETLSFYSLLGFKIVSTTPPLSSNGNAHQEAWLHLYPPVNQNEPEPAKAGLGFTLRVVVEEQKGFDEDRWKDSIEAKFYRLKAEQHVKDAAWGCFVVSDIKDIQTILDEEKHPYASNAWQPTNESDLLAQTIPFTGTTAELSGPAPVCLLTYDPLGNLLTFTDRATPFGVAKATPKRTTTPPNKHKRQLSLGPRQPVSAADFDAVLSEIGEKKKRIGVLTSGGDSSGMNAAVRSITRYALQKGCIPYAIYEGYQGLVDGGDNIKQLGWEDVRGLLAVGGTSIGTARCAAFRTREGRLTAVFNLIKNGIDALIVCGGDGSLTGADMLRAEWKGLVDELVEAGRVTADECEHLREDLTIVGLVGSIDNDMSSTDITIGAFTALHRICEAVDSLTSTALSHQRAFVVEVMGRHCGWLGLMAAIAVGADWVFLPERPPPLDTARYGEDWEKEMCDTIMQYRAMGNRKSIVLVCEGAIDRQLNPIKADDVRKILSERLGLDTRVTTLGHVQRGGTPCAYDRFLATVQGVEAVDAVLRSKPGMPAPMIGMSQNKIISVPLMDAVKLTHAVAEAIGQKDFARAMELRDPDFTSAYDAYIESTLLGGPGARKVEDGKQLRIAIICTGAPAGGMNAATRIAARLCLNRGHVPLAIRNGFSGLVNDEVSPLSWQDVVGWQVRGGSELGTNRDHPCPLPGGPAIAPKGSDKYVDLGMIAYSLQKHDVEGLLIIGGFEAYTSQLVLTHARKTYPAFCIPMVQLPATVSNNVPGTDYSIGSDTALNAIVEACDRIKTSANASRKRVFVVEVQGGNCGYLATVGGLISGATTVYIPEEGINISTLQADIQHLCRRYTAEDRRGIPNEGRVILRSELVSTDTYTTDVISRILRAEGKGLFDSRTAVLGHLQQGGVPSPLDRIRATRLAVNCVNWLEQTANDARILSSTPSACGSSVKKGRVHTTSSSTSCVIGIRGAQIVFTPVADIYKEADIKTRRGKDEWWMYLKGLIRILSKYEFEEREDEGERVELLKLRK
ncbi:6-phosphofructokinase, alpha subunit, partial [Borealophlyctis nickersoniae]